MAAALLVGACCGMVGCDKDNDDGPSDPDVTAVQGSYSGTMTIVQAAPTADGEEAPAGAAVTASVSADKILFENFPVRDLIVAVVGEEMADQLMAQIGQVDYAVPYTALMNDDMSGIVLTLSPEALKLTLTPDAGDGGDAEGESDAATEIEVTIASSGEGAYDLESKKLLFGLSATAVKLGGQEVPFQGLSLSFDLERQ